jgi:hypothetical protein
MSREISTKKRQQVYHQFSTETSPVLRPLPPPNFPKFSTKALGVIKFRTVSIRTKTLTHVKSAVYDSQCPTAPHNQLMAQRQMSWNPTAL